MFEFKRRITINQLNELSENAKKKLNNLWEPIPFDIVYDLLNDRICVIKIEIKKIRGIRGIEGITIKSIVDISEIKLQFEKKNILPLLDISQMI